MSTNEWTREDIDDALGDLTGYSLDEGHVLGDDTLALCESVLRRCRDAAPTNEEADGVIGIPSDADIAGSLYMLRRRLEEVDDISQDEKAALILAAQWADAEDWPVSAVGREKRGRHLADLQEIWNNLVELGQTAAPISTMVLVKRMLAALGVSVPTSDERKVWQGDEGEETGVMEFDPHDPEAIADAVIDLGARVSRLEKLESSGLLKGAGLEECTCDGALGCLGPPCIPHPLSALADDEEGET